MHVEHRTVPETPHQYIILISLIMLLPIRLLSNNLVVTNAHSLPMRCCRRACRRRATYRNFSTHFLETRIAHHASRITHHASRITHHASRIMHHAFMLPIPSSSSPSAGCCRSLPQMRPRTRAQVACLAHARQTRHAVTSHPSATATPSVVIMSSLP